MANINAMMKRAAVRMPFVKAFLLSSRARRRPVFANVAPLVKDRQGLEIGGPSPVFARAGPLPIYALASGIDNVNFSDENFWSTIKGGQNFHFDDAHEPGRQIISDAIVLPMIADESYDFILSSHSIEHIANPIKALREWRRVLRPGGALVIIAPDMRHTYDRNRPLTKLSHIIEDFEHDTPESDETHLAEIVELHDLSNDGTVASFEEHRVRTLDNARQRIAHHHVFDIDLLAGLVTEAGFVVAAQDVFPAVSSDGGSDKALILGLRRAGNGFIRKKICSTTSG